MSHQKKIWLGGVGFAIIFGLCLILPWLFNMDAQSVHLEQRLLPVSFTHLFGTDILGRSQLARILVGGKTTLGFALVAVAMSGTIGVFIKFLWHRNPLPLGGGRSAMLLSILEFQCISGLFRRNFANATGKITI